MTSPYLDIMYTYISYVRKYIVVFIYKTDYFNNNLTILLHLIAYLLYSNSFIKMNKLTGFTTCYKYVLMGLWNVINVQNGM